MNLIQKQNLWFFDPHSVSPPSWFRTQLCFMFLQLHRGLQILQLTSIMLLDHEFEAYVLSVDVCISVYFHFKLFMFYVI